MFFFKNAVHLKEENLEPVTVVEDQVRAAEEDVLLSDLHKLKCQLSKSVVELLLGNLCTEMCHKFLKFGNPKIFGRDFYYG